jgi:hypothetical protein
MTGNVLRQTVFAATALMPEGLAVVSLRRTGWIR